MNNLNKPRAGAALVSPAELQAGIANLSRGLYFKEASLDMMLSILTESAARTSGVERVSIWALTDDQQELRCLELFECQSEQHRKGGSVHAQHYPVYFAALRESITIAADDALAHPLTAEFSADYLLQHNVTAILDTPIHIRGELQGVLSFEQVGVRQPWTSGHHLFAQAVANLVTLALVEYEAGEARKRAQSADERLRAVFEASREALFLADGESGEILDLNREAERLLERSREELFGRHHASLFPPEQQPRVAGEFRRLLDGDAPWTLVTEVQRGDGRRLPVEVTAEVAAMSDGRRLALSVFRPF